MIFHTAINRGFITASVTNDVGSPGTLAIASFVAPVANGSGAAPGRNIQYPG